jgi:hypothetical protein
VWFSTLVNDLEWEALDIGLYFGIGEFTTNETLGVEDTGQERRSICWLTDTTTAVENSRVVRVHRCLVLCGVTDTTFGTRERNTGGGCPVTVVVGDDLNVIISPDTDTTVWAEMSTRENRISARDDLRVGGAQIDTDGSAGHVGWDGYRWGLDVY